MEGKNLSYKKEENEKNRKKSNVEGRRSQLRMLLIETISWKSEWTNLSNFVNDHLGVCDTSFTRS